MKGNDVGYRLLPLVAPKFTQSDVGLISQKKKQTLGVRVFVYFIITNGLPEDLSYFLKSIW